MDACVAGQDSGLLAVAGLSEAQLASLCQRHSVYLAIQLGLGSVILGGKLPALSAAEQEIVACGGSAKPLAVALASHTPLLAAGVPAMTELLAATALAAPSASLIFNWSGQPAFRPEAIRRALAHQIAHTVRWDACMDAMREQGVRCVLEMGPGAHLSRLWNARFAHIPARSIDEFRQAQGVAAWVRATLSR